MVAYFWLGLVLYTIAASHSPKALAQSSTSSIDIGVCYGLLGNDLPEATEVIKLYKQYGIGKIRLFDPNPAALQALRGQQIDVTVGIRNEDVPLLGASQEAVNAWFETNIAPYLNDVVFEYITVGNEIVPGFYGAYIPQVMEFLQQILDARNLHGIKVSTVLAASVLGSSFPPSAGAFTAEASAQSIPILNILSKQGSPILINVYPYFAYASQPDVIRLDYAQFTAPEAVVRDGSLSYSNLFDAMVDAFISAMENVGVSDVSVVVSESGWPSAGNGNLTTPELAATYNKNFIKHITSMSGTPKRPGAYIEGFVFAMFNENQKPAGVEQNFGLFYPNKNPVYTFT